MGGQVDWEARRVAAEYGHAGRPIDARALAAFTRAYRQAAWDRAAAGGDA